ncbi:MAG: precorrin-3B synthase [Alphaproteobacteria bacterium]
MAERLQDIADMQRSLRPSACPGLFRIVPARDGGLCRLRIPLGCLSAGQARAIADAAARFGSGIADVTNRANLQLRGIAPEAEPALIEALLRAGLGPPRSDTDDIRNVMVSPLAGIDPSQDTDVLPLARGLLHALETEPAYRGLSPKFGLLVDGGESVAAIDHPHDIWLASVPGGRAFALGIAGCPPVAADDATPFLLVAPERAGTAAATALAVFLETASADKDATRMRHLLARTTRDMLLSELARRIDGAALSDAATSGWHRRPVDPQGHIGRRPQRQDGLETVGAVPPVGRLSPAGLHAIADIAERFGGGELRLTPFRSLLLPAVPSRHAAAAAAALAGIGMICDPAAPLARMVACAGLAGCLAARAETKTDAVALAALMRTGTEAGIHLSGCEKSCAMPNTADVTLVATAPGRYDLFRRNASGGNRFGDRHGRALALAEIADELRARDGTEC